MKTELQYIEIENTKDGFKTHAGVHTQLDIYSPCRLIFVIQYGAPVSKYRREIISSKIMTPYTDIFLTLHNQFNVGDGVHSRTKTERQKIMLSFVDMVCVASRDPAYENELVKINENKATALFQLEYISMIVNEKSDALSRAETLRMRKKLCTPKKK